MSRRAEAAAVEILSGNRERLSTPDVRDIIDKHFSAAGLAEHIWQRLSGPARLPMDNFTLSGRVLHLEEVTEPRWIKPEYQLTPVQELTTATQSWLDKQGETARTPMQRAAEQEYDERDQEIWDDEKEGE